MDGRRFSRWVVVGWLAAGAAGCKTPSTGLPGPPPPGKSAQAAMGGVPQGVTPGLPPEMAPPRPKKTGPMPEFESAYADTHIERAFADPPPPDRDALLDTARARYARALKADPKHKGALLGMARMYARLGERERALEWYKKYLKAYPEDAGAAHELAYAHARWGDWAGAVGWCDAALKADPENRTVAKTKGFCLARAGRTDEAVAVLCRVMPESQARFHVAEALDDMGAFDASREQLHLALRADPNFVPAREVLVELDTPPAAPAADPNPVVPAGHQEPGGR